MTIIGIYIQFSSLIKADFLRLVHILGAEMAKPYFSICLTTGKKPKP